MTWHIEAENFDHNKSQSIAAIRASVAGFSAFLLKQNTAREHPEVVALAFWFRQVHLTQITAAMPSELEDKTVHRVFHIAPVNVDTVFMYSVLLSVLCANQNIVRVSQRSGEVTWLLISLLKEYLSLPEGQALASQIAIVEYDARHEDMTEQLTNWCDLRVIWGGDEAIRAISSIAPQTAQVCFPDRYSVAILALDNTSDIVSIASGLLADVLPFNQQACSSPKALYWLNTPRHLQQQFWFEVENQLHGAKHQLDISNKVEQQINLQYLAAAFGLTIDAVDEHPDISFARIHSVGVLGRCKVRQLTVNMLASHTGNGLLLEQDITSPDVLAFSDKLQTIACAGTAQSLDIHGEYKRTIRLGSSLEFASVWDGIDLLQVFY